jgi:hypothetical protein
VRQEPEPEEQPAAQDLPQPEQQVEEGEELPPYENVQQPQAQALPAPQPRTLLGRVSFVALNFLASLIPGQPLPDYGLLQ